MRRWTGLSLALCLVACEGGEIAIFSANQPGSAGASGLSGSSGASDTSAGTAGVTAGAFSGGAAGDAGADAAGSSGTSDPPCQSNADCYSNYYCSKQSCGDAQGHCLPRPLDDGSSEHVCGCDHITYWNDSIRQQLGVAASTQGQCGMDAKTCRTQPCPDPASCALFLGPSQVCGSPLGPGQCWVLPVICPFSDPTDSAQYQICPPPGSSGGSPPPCVTSCQAIQSGHPFMQLPHGQTCP